MSNEKHRLSGPRHTPSIVVSTDAEIDAQEHGKPLRQSRETTRQDSTTRYYCDERFEFIRQALPQFPHLW
jgi:hypothetical protein